MDVLILHDEIAEGTRPDELDALEQVAAVEASLQRAGHRVERLAVGLDLVFLRHELEARRPDLIFNLVEAPGGSGRMIHLPLAIVEALRIPCTGADQTAMLLSSSKLATKRLLRLAGLPTAASYELQELQREETLAADIWILKSVWEHGSVGLDEDSVIETRDPRVLARELEARREALLGEGFAEAYIEGREFNISVIASADGPLVLPPAEISFQAFEPGKRRVVGYRAKWQAESFEYANTPRRFGFAAEDAALLAELEELSRSAFSLFGLGGHARVDFRVDEEGRPFILEVNANPCIAPDAGFAAAAAEAGLGFDGAVRMIVADALRRAGRAQA